MCCLCVGRLLSMLYYLSRYFFLLVTPSTLCYDHSYADIAPVNSINDCRNILSIAFLLICLTITRYSLGRTCLFTLCSLIFMLVPSIIFSNIFFPVGTVLGERLLYLPSIGFCMLIGRCVSNTHKLTRPFVFVFFIVVVALFVIKSRQRTFDWNAEDVLFLKDVEGCPRSVKILNNAGVVLMNKGDLSTAGRYLQLAVDLRPSFKEVYGNLGLLLYKQTRYSDAIQTLEHSARLNSTNSEDYAYLGMSYLALGNRSEAIRNLRMSTGVLGSSKFMPFHELGKLLLTSSCVESIRLLEVAASLLQSNRKTLLEWRVHNPLNIRHQLGVILGDLALAYQSCRLFKQSVLTYRKAIQLTPSAFQIYNNYGLVLLEMASDVPTGRTTVWGLRHQLLLAAARWSLTKAYRLQPTSAEVLNNLGRFYERVRRKATAAHYFSKALSVAVQQKASFQQVIEQNLARIRFSISAERT
eukprot:GILJ01018209.1.p1 GENE.GILJ01018209.1~~GILJ01018209.1.p1  ORF type:complete len:468 (+),score=50.22 GILJ01018209.1:48-1451(+)